MGLLEKLGLKQSSTTTHNTTENEQVDKEQYQRLENVLEQLTNPVIGLEPDGSIFLFTAGASNFLQLEPFKAESRIFDIVLPIEPQKKIKTAFFRAMRNRAEQAVEGTARDRPTLFKLRPIFDYEKHIIGVLLSLEDITEQKRLQQMQVDFVSFVSHELRTPISNIKGYLDVVLQEADYLDEEHRKFIHRAYLGNERQEDTVEKLLELSNVEQGTLRVDKQKVNLDSIIRDKVGAWRPKAQQKGINLEYIFPHFNLPPVWGDKHLVQSILENLLENAVKYTESGKITVKTEHTGNSVTTSVVDTGIGIPKELHTEVFTKFVRGEHSLTETTQGSGLGLYLTRRFVELMGGTMHLDSQKGQGSKFSFTLPVANPPSR